MLLFFGGCQKKNASYIAGAPTRPKPVYIPIVTFNGGYFSPHMEARGDFAKYQNSCRTLENFLITAQGPAVKRPGTKYIATSVEDDDVSRLIPFQYSTDDTYILEFTYHSDNDPNGTLYFYRDGGQIEAP